MGNVGHCLDLYVDQHIVFQMRLKLDSRVMLKLLNLSRSFKVLSRYITEVSSGYKSLINNFAMI